MKCIATHVSGYVHHIYQDIVKIDGTNVIHAPNKPSNFIVNFIPFLFSSIAEIHERKTLSTQSYVFPMYSYHFFALPPSSSISCISAANSFHCECILTSLSPALPSSLGSPVDWITTRHQ